MKRVYPSGVLARHRKKRAEFRRAERRGPRPKTVHFVRFCDHGLFIFNNFGGWTVHLVRSSEIEFESCYAGKEATHDTPLRQVHRRWVRRTHNQRERQIDATPHRIVRSNVQEIKLRC